MGEVLLETKGMPKLSVTMKLSILKGNHMHDVIMDSHIKVLGTETMIDHGMEIKFLTTVPPFDHKYKKWTWFLLSSHLNFLFLSEINLISVTYLCGYVI